MRKSFTRLLGLSMALMLVLIVNLAFGQVYVPKGGEPNFDKSVGISVTFDQTVTYGTIGQVTLFEGTDGTGTAVFQKSIGQAKGTEVVITGNKVVFNLPLAEKKTYFLTWDATAIKTVAGSNNVSAPATWTFTVGDYTAPLMVAIGAPVKQNQTPTEVKNGNLVISFNENVGVTTGTEKVYLMKVNSVAGNNDDVVHIFDKSSTITIGAPTSAGVTTVTLSLASVDIPDNADMYVIMESGFIRDVGTNSLSFAGISDKATWAFSTRDTTTPQVELLLTDMGPSFVEYDVESNKSGTLYWLVGTNNIGTPTDTYVKSGTFTANYLRRGSVSLSGSSKVSFTVGTLTNTALDGTKYDLFYVTETPGSLTPTISSVTKVDIDLDDVVAPSVVLGSSTPLGTTVANDAQVLIKFDEPVRMGEGNVTIHDKDGVFVQLNVATGRILNNDELHLAVDKKFASASTYTVTLDFGIVTDRSENPYKGMTASWTFKVGDYDAPTVKSNTPANSATGIEASALNNPTTGGIRIEFNEAIRKWDGTSAVGVTTGTTVGTSNLESAFKLYENGVATDVLVVAYTSNTLQLRKASGSFVDNANYQLNFLSWNVSDANSNAMSDLLVYTFSTKDTKAPEIESFYASTVKEDLAGNKTAANNAQLWLEFSEKIFVGNTTTALSGSNLNHTLEVFNGTSTSTVNTNQYTVQVATTDTSSIVKLIPVSTWLDGGSYKLTFVATGFQDAAGNAFTGVNNKTIKIADEVAPTVALTYPSSQTAAAALADVVLTFTDASALLDLDKNPLASSLVSPTLVTLRKGGANGTVVSLNGAISYNAGTKTLTIASGVLTAGNSYELTVNSGIQDEFGNKLAATTFNFIIASTTAPAVVQSDYGVYSTVPLADATGVAANSSISAEFKEGIVANGSVSSITIEYYNLETMATGTIAVTSFDISGNTLSINHNPLPGNSTVTVTLGAGLVKAQSGSNTNSAFSWTFTTVETIKPAPTAYSPAVGATNVAIGNVLAIEFANEKDQLQLSGNNGYLELIETDSQAKTTLVLSSSNTKFWYTGNDATVSITLSADLKPNTNYEVKVIGGPIQDKSGNLMDNIEGDTWTFTTTTSSFAVVQDDPTKLYNYRDNYATGTVSLNVKFTNNVHSGNPTKTIKLEKMDNANIGSASETIFTLNPTDGAFVWSNNELTINFPTTPLVASSTYMLTFEAGVVTDVYNQPLTGTTITFFTGNRNGPVATFTPAHDAEVGNIENVSIEFDEVLYYVSNTPLPGTLTAATKAYIESAITNSTITFTEGGTATSALIGTYTVTLSNRTVGIQFAKGTLAATKSYTLTVAANGFVNSEGTPYKVFTTDVTGAVAAQSATFNVRDYSKPTVSIGNVLAATGSLSSTLNFEVTVNKPGTFQYLITSTTASPTTWSGSTYYNGTTAVPVVHTGLATTAKVNQYIWVRAVDENGESNLASYTFTTGDNVAPKITAFRVGNTDVLDADPTSLVTGISRTASLTLVFDEEVPTPAGAVVYVRDTNGLLVGSYSITSSATVSKAVSYGALGTHTATTSSFTLTLDGALLSTLKENTEYTLEIVKDLIEDVSGNKYITHTTRRIKTLDNVKPSVTLAWSAEAKTVTSTYVGSVNKAEVKSVANVTLNFDEPVKFGTSSSVFIYEDSNTTSGTIAPGATNTDDRLVEVISNVVLASDGLSAQFSIDASRLELNKVYAVYVATATFSDFGSPANTLSATLTEFFVLADQQAPLAEFSYSIAQGSNDPANENIDVSTAIIVSFDEAIQWKPFPLATIDARLLGKMVSLVNNDGDNIEVTLEYQTATNTILSGTVSHTIKVTPKKLLEGHHTYVLTVKDVQDVNGYAPSSNYVLTFTTGDKSRRMPPVAVFSPEHDALKVEASGPFVVTFDKNILAYVNVNSLLVEGPVTSVNAADYFEIKVGATVANTSVSATYTVTDGKIVTITPVQPVTSTYVVRYGLKTTADIYDSYGNKLAGSLNESGVTYAEVQVKDWEGLAMPTLSPNAGSTRLDADLTMTFGEYVYKGVGNLYIRNHETGQLVTTIAADSDKVSVKGMKVTVKQDVLEENTKYYVVVDSGFVTDYYGNGWNGITDVNINSWTFTTRDISGPQVVAQSPAPGSTNVLVNEKVVLEFDQAVNLGSGYLVLYHEDGTPFKMVNINTGTSVPVQTYGVQTTTLEWTVGPLESHTKYYVRVTEGAIVDLSGVKFTGIYGQAWEFTTEDTSAPVVEATLPADDATDVVRNPLFEIHFKNNVLKGSGQIRIYPRDGVTPLETINVTSANVVVSGNEVHFHFETLLSANAEYYIYVQPGAFTNASTNKLAFAGITTAWGWNFTTGATIVDRDAPTIVDHSPVGVQETVHQEFMIEFNEAIVAGTGKLHVYEAATDSLVLLLDVADAVIDGNVITFSYDKDDFSLTVSTEYYVLVEAGVVVDESGNEFAGIADKTMWVFTTGDEYATSAPEIAHSNFKLYPNPFNNELNIDNHNKLSRVIITNIAGQRVMDIQFPERTISTSNLVSGVYIVTMVTNEGTTQSERIVKR